MAISSTKALTGLRVAVGILFVIFGEYKVFGVRFTIGGGFQYWINRFLQDGAYPFMVSIGNQYPKWQQSFQLVIQRRSSRSLIESAEGLRTIPWMA
jgi:hypothetical protein